MVKSDHFLHSKIKKGCFKPLIGISLIDLLSTPLSELLLSGSSPHPNADANHGQA
jgi:hypothetical protein